MTSKNQERRVSERVPAKFMVNYIHQGDYLISHSKDISVSGMFLHTDNPPKVGEKTSLEFDLPNGDKLLLKADVIWVNNHKESKDSGMAIQFSNTSTEEEESILDFIRKIAILD